jgi:Helicase associated domain
MERLVLACYRSNTFWRSATENGTLASSWSIPNIERWETGVAALLKFRRREGHCCPERRHVEGNFKLGQWVSVQRYRKDFLPIERKRLLETIGFVWDCRDQLLRFKRREGHCCVPTFHSEDGRKLGWWVATQRRKRGIVNRAKAAIKQDRICMECRIYGSDYLSTKSPSRQSRSATR